MTTNKKSEKICEQCGGKNLEARRTTYPIKMETKQLNIERVSVRECMDCHALMPTKAGQEKITRCMMNFMMILHSF